MSGKSIYVHGPDDVPKVEHWAIITGSYVHHEEAGVWAPGHGYPAYTEKVVEYEAFLDEKEFLSELERRFSSSYLSPNAIGIHVNKQYTKQTIVRIVENSAP